MGKILKEPLLHFLIVGACLFLLYECSNKNTSANRAQIILTNADLEQMITAYENNWSQVPDTQTLRGLVDEHVRGEIMYQEALHLGLEHNDEIIKRRLRQKYEFLVKDLSSIQQPETEELERFYEEHAESYQSARKMSFSHIYFSPDKRKEPLLDAQKLLKEVSNKDVKPEAYGDDFHLQQFYASRDYREIVQNYGKQFSDTLFSQSSTGWQKPILSGYGVHLVHISSIEEPESIPFPEVKNLVLQDWKAEQLKRFNDELYESLLGNYEVIHQHDFF
ncbi:MAG: peptidylprolyl isomerase [Bacteroidia bacterium]|nr:peptidylprolyl isomerase [Bacteroidia bacterium]